MNKEVAAYYDKIADQYDADRFENSYGNFIDKQEKTLVSKWLQDITPDKCLDLGCGTGRFLTFAKYGHDVSPDMIKVAQSKFPERVLSVGTANKTPFNHDTFEAILCFHVFMHLDKNTVADILEEAHRILNKNGVFIFDLPSKHRRKLTNYKAKNWHGANDYTLLDLKNLVGHDWTISAFRGIILLPIHRFPSSFRMALARIDAWLNASFLKKYSSYWVVKIQKN